jgi:hypothetical protein
MYPVIFPTAERPIGTKGCKEKGVSGEILTDRLVKSKNGGILMSERKYRVRAECPQCACGDISFLGPEKLREKFIGNEDEIEVTCPLCATKHKGKIEFEEKE